MGSRSAGSSEAQAPAEQRGALLQDASQTDRAAVDQASALARSARAFAARCHARQRRESDGAPFIEHPLEVARLLRDAGCSDVLVAAGLLHDVVESTDVSAAELRARFGAAVANLVQAVTDRTRVESYRLRKQVLREQVRSAGVDAALLFAADKISKVRELPDLARRDRARFVATPRATRARDHMEHDHQMRLEHYRESLRMLQLAAPGHALVQRLARELDSCAIAIGRGAGGDHEGRIPRGQADRPAPS
jgi:(p)ppGpp synthase/HD superfamily hydrolase